MIQYLNIYENDWKNIFEKTPLLNFVNIVKNRVPKKTLRIHVYRDYR